MLAHSYACTNTCDESNNFPTGLSDCVFASGGKTLLCCHCCGNVSLAYFLKILLFLGRLTPCS